MTTEETNPAVETPKVERVKQNGVTRPAEGTTTGNVWAGADQMSQHLGRPVLAAELVEHLGEGYNKSTIATQYNLWCNFNGVTAEQRKAVRDEGKAEEQAAKDAEKAAAKEAKAAEKAAAKQEKADAKAAAKATKDAEKAEAKAAKDAAAAPTE